jgi:hypothetical protein
METNEIKLNFNKPDYEEVYFKNRGEKLLLLPTIKKQFTWAIISGILFISALIYSMIAHRSWGIFTIITLIFILVVKELIEKISPEIKWKKSIRALLDKQAKIITNRLILSPNALTLKQDHTVTVVRWTDFKKAVIDDKSISLYGDEKLVFPKKSMTWQEFELLKKEVLAGIQK